MRNAERPEVLARTELLGAELKGFEDPEAALAGDGLHPYMVALPQSS